MKKAVVEVGNSLVYMIFVAVLLLFMIIVMYNISVKANTEFELYDYQLRTEVLSGKIMNSPEGLAYTETNDLNGNKILNIRQNLLDEFKFNDEWVEYFLSATEEDKYYLRISKINPILSDKVYRQSSVLYSYNYQQNVGTEYNYLVYVRRMPLLEYEAWLKVKEKLDNERLKNHGVILYKDKDYSGNFVVLDSSTSDFKDLVYDDRSGNINGDLTSFKVFGENDYWFFYEDKNFKGQLWGPFGEGNYNNYEDSSRYISNRIKNDAPSSARTFKEIFVFHNKEKYGDIRSLVSGSDSIKDSFSDYFYVPDHLRILKDEYYFIKINYTRYSISKGEGITATAVVGPFGKGKYTWDSLVSEIPEEVNTNFPMEISVEKIGEKNLTNYIKYLYNLAKIHKIANEENFMDWAKNNGCKFENAYGMSSSEKEKFFKECATNLYKHIERNLKDYEEVEAAWLTLGLRN